MMFRRARLGEPQARSLRGLRLTRSGRPLALEPLGHHQWPILTSFFCIVVQSHQSLLAHGKPHAQNPARRTGRGSGGVGLLAVLLAATRPDQGVALAIRIIEQVGEDRCGEARVVELEGEVGPALVRLLRPGGPDLGTTDEDPMAGGIVVGPIGLGDDAHALGLDAERHDLALVLVAGLLEGTDVSHVSLLAVSNPRPSRPRWRSAGRRRSTTHPLAGRSRAEDGGAETFLPREEWAKPRGRKSQRRHCGSGDRGAAVLWPDQPRRGRGSAPNSILGRRRG